jgi:hypothetical protein
VLNLACGRANPFTSFDHTCQQKTQWGCGSFAKLSRKLWKQLGWPVLRQGYQDKNLLLVLPNRRLSRRLCPLIFSKLEYFYARFSEARVHQTISERFYDESYDDVRTVVEEGKGLGFSIKKLAKPIWGFCQTKLLQVAELLCTFA